MSKNANLINLSHSIDNHMPDPQKVLLYDPHPGFMGAAIPLPEPMKKIARQLEGKVMSLEETIEMISPVATEAGGTLEIVEKYKFIGFRVKERSGREHYFRLIRYK
ncbi:hypothetical protein HZB03_03930 [Candidatus Woesearchaeota archaeon]|nr:hypothetical protein [Candidatus Woesearchaeota archaeon]